jgi:hypothetical protein
MGFAVADPDYGVHTFDILTILRPNGEIGIASCLLWGNCEAETSHSTQNGYSIDIHTCKVVEPVRHYSAYFTKDEAQTAGKYNYYNKKMKGLEEAF